MIYGFKVFLDCQSFSSQGTVPIRDTPLIASFHVSWRHLGSGYVCSVRDTSSRVSFHVSRWHFGLGYVFLSATHSFGGKNLYRELEIGGMRVILSAIHSFCRNTLCRVLKRDRGNVFRLRHTLKGQFSCVAVAFWFRVCVCCLRHTLLA